MDLATVFGVTAVLELAAAFAGWVGGIAFAVCRPVLRAPAWRYVVAMSASVGLAVLAYLSALVALGQGAVISGRADHVPAAPGLLLMAAVFGLGAGAPWGLFRHAGVRADPHAESSDVVEFWMVARGISARLFLPFAILGLAILAPRADGKAPGIVGTILIGALLAVVLAATFATTVRHRGPIFRMAGWGAFIGVPLIAVMMMLSGVGPGDAFVFSAASAVVWAPVFGFITWGVTGTHDAGFRITPTGLVTPSPQARYERAAETHRRRRTPRQRRRR